MKSINKCMIIVFISLILIISKGTYAICYKNNEEINTNNKESVKSPITFQQTKAQVYLFKKVLDELGATSPSEAVELWAKSKGERNGVYQYAVSCDNLKQKIIEKWGKAEDNYWIYGGSSPWTNKYEIIKNEKIDETTYKVTLKFYWMTSAGEEPPSYDTLTIVKGKKYWCVKDVKELTPKS